MICYVANCGHDENGKWMYGMAGDQSGTEFYITPWFNFRQNCVLHHPDSNVRELIATLAKQAAYNNHIGYDQNERMTFYNALKEKGWYPERIDKNVETDCSASTCAIVYAAGMLLKNSQITNNISPWGYTGNMRRMFEKAGFDVRTASKYLNTGNYLYTGDINLNESQHTNIVVAGAAYTDSQLIVDGWIGKYTVTELQKQLGTYADGLIEGQNIDNIRYLERLESVTWECTGSPCIRALQKRIGATVDGLAGFETVRKLQTYLNKMNSEYLVVDGYLGSYTACALQRALNAGVFRKP